MQNPSPSLPFTPTIFGWVLNIASQVHLREIVNWCLCNFMHMYANIFVCKNTLKRASPVETALHMLIMFLCLLLTAHLYICSYKYTQTNPIRSGEQSKRWHDYKQSQNSRLQRAMRPFHGGALWGLKSLGKIHQMCDEERWRREPRQKGTLWLCSARMPTQTRAQSN